MGVASGPGNFSWEVGNYETAISKLFVKHLTLSLTCS